MPLYFLKPHSFLTGAILGLILTVILLVMCGFYVASQGVNQVIEPVNSVAFGS
jgi:hypothetical protein